MCILTKERKKEKNNEQRKYSHLPQKRSFKCKRGE